MNWKININELGSYIDSIKVYIYKEKKIFKRKRIWKKWFWSIFIIKYDFSQVEIDKFIAIDFKSNKIENIDGWILSEFEINMGMLPIIN